MDLNRNETTEFDEQIPTTLQVKGAVFKSDVFDERADLTKDGVIDSNEAESMKEDANL